MKIISYFLISFAILFSYSLFLSWNIKRKIKSEKIVIYNNKVNVINNGIFFISQEIFSIDDIKEIKILNSSFDIKNKLFVLDVFQISIKYISNNNYYENVDIRNLENSLQFIKYLKEKFPNMYIEFISTTMFIIPNILKILENSMENI